jgi:hypothetical protein
MTDEQETTEETATEMPNAVQTQRNATIEGVEIESLGQTWKLARLGLAKSITKERDSIYEESTLTGKVSMRDIRACAWYMLEANYKIEPEQAILIIKDADQEDLVDATVAAAFVDRYSQNEETYTNWVRSALLTNGIDPAKISNADVPHVLRQLVATNRAMPITEFCAADRHVQMKAELLRTV